MIQTIPPREGSKNRKMGVENKIPLIFELPVDRSRETPAILIEKKMEAREREVKLPTEVPTSSHCLPTEIRPSSLNRARAHTSRVHARSPMRLDLFLSLLSFFSFSLRCTGPVPWGTLPAFYRTYLLGHPVWDPSLGLPPLLVSSLGSSPNR